MWVPPGIRTPGGFAKFRRIRRDLWLAKGCSFLALLIALSTGTAYAANTFTNSLTTADVRGADVNGGHISIDGGAVANGRCRDFSMTIAGAHSGEAVVFSLQTWG